MLRLWVHLAAITALALSLASVFQPEASAAPELEVTLKPVTPTVNVGLTATVEATVTYGGDPVDNATVSFAVTGAHNLGPRHDITVDGVAQLSYSETTPGTDFIQASAQYTPPGGSSVTATGEPVPVVWSTNAFKLSLTPATQTATPGVSARVTAKVTDTSGDAISGIGIGFSVAGANPRTSSCTTTASGTCSMSYLGHNPGTDTVTATISNTDITGTATIEWPGNGGTTAPTVTLSPADQVALTGENVSVTATAIDANGDPISDTEVTFTVTGQNPTSDTETTGTDGKATFTYAGANAGGDQVVAATDSVSSSAATVRWLAAPLQLDLSTPSDTLTAGSRATIQATLTDGDGTVVGDISVVFSASGANSATGTAATNASGRAAFSYTGANSGTDTVSAYADLNGNSTQDDNEPSASGSIVWAAAGPPPVTIPTEPAQPKEGCTYYAETSHNLCGGFREYWNDFGGLAIYGFPLTDELQENGVTVQYFERARFEWHAGKWPERYDVMLGLLGRDVTAGRSAEAPFMSVDSAPDPTNCTYYAAVGHNLCSGFRAYWEKYGGLAVFGMPISEEFVEQNPDTGQMYTVQYFERARFEWHPGEWPERYDVELGRLGAQVLQMHIDNR